MMSLQRIINVPKRGIGNATFSALQDAVEHGHKHTKIHSEKDSENVLSTGLLPGPGVGELIENLRRQKQSLSTDFITTC